MYPHADCVWLLLLTLLLLLLGQGYSQIQCWLACVLCWGEQQQH